MLQADIGITEQAMDQMFMMRPTYEAAQYATPVPVYSCVVLVRIPEVV